MVAIRCPGFPNPTFRIVLIPSNTLNAKHITYLQVSAAYTLERFHQFSGSPRLRSHSSLRTFTLIFVYHHYRVIQSVIYMVPWDGCVLALPVCCYVKSRCRPWWSSLSSSSSFPRAVVVVVVCAIVSIADKMLPGVVSTPGAVGYFFIARGLCVCV